MSRYIDADKFIQYIQTTFAKPLERNIFCEKEVISLIAQQPTADVKEVVRGEWIMDDDDILGMSFACSVCGFEQEESLHLNFCPHCGADMRGGLND